MLFTAKIVEDRPAGKIMIGIAVTGIFFILVSTLVKELNGLAPFFLCILILSIIVMAIITKGNLSSYQLVNDLQIFADGMQISQWIYPFQELGELVFEFQSYQDVKSDNGGRQSYESYGLGNSLSFVYKNRRNGQKVG